jgi:glyoxalase-like protein
VRAFESRYGLAATAGGRHPGVGTANAIVPLGGSQYLELITVVDRAEAERAPLRSRVLTALDSGATFAGWALRSDDLEAAGRLLPLGDIAGGARERPDGVRLEWRTAELGGGALPFLIEWRTPEHPGRGGVARPVRRAVVQEASGEVRELLSRADLDVEVELQAGAPPRLVALELDGLTIR